MSSTVIGLDIGNGVIRAAEIADAGKARPTLVRYHSIAVPTSAVQRGEVVEQGTFASALKQLWANAGFKSKKVVLGMGNQRVLVRDLSLPKMPLDRIRESLPFHAQDLLPVPVGDALLDFYPISTGDGDNGEVINGLLVAAIKDAVLHNVEAVQAAGLDPVEVDLIPFALARSMLGGMDAPGTVGLIHVGATTSSVIVARDGIPQFVRIMQNGGDDVTGALVQRLGMTSEQAEQVKRAIGLAPTGTTAEWAPAVEAMTRSTNDLLDGVRNTLSFYLNSRPGVAIDKLMLSGGAAQLIGLPNALAEATRLSVGIPNPLGRFALGRQLDATRLRTEYSGVAVAAGLAMGSRA
ncbi:type IV pilus assembly protein PilM [soil metagenome]